MYVLDWRGPNKKANQPTHCLATHQLKDASNPEDPSYEWYVKPSYFPPKVVRCNEWQRRTRNKLCLDMPNLREELASGYDSPWLTWRCLNLLWSGYTCSQEQRKKWGYYEGDTTCACSLDPENTADMLRCSLLPHPCTLDDLIKFNDLERNVQTDFCGPNNDTNRFNFAGLNINFHNTNSII